MVYCNKLTKLILKNVPNVIETENALLKDMFRLYGFLKVITTDQRTQFSSQEWEELLEFFGTEVNFTSTSHHQTVSQIERKNNII